MFFKKKKIKTTALSLGETLFCSAFRTAQTGLGKRGEIKISDDELFLKEMIIIYMFLISQKMQYSYFYSAHLQVKVLDGVHDAYFKLMTFTPDFSHLPAFDDNNYYKLNQFIDNLHNPDADDISEEVYHLQQKYKEYEQDFKESKKYSNSTQGIQALTLSMQKNLQIQNNSIGAILDLASDIAFFKKYILSDSIFNNFELTE